MQLKIGSISHGTLRPEDLAQAICDELLSLGHSESESLIQDLLAIAEDSHMDYSDEVIADGIEELQSHAPEYCYVGMHEGDGSDLGVWPCFDQIESDVHSGEIIKISDLSELDALGVEECNATHAMLVNDHGNMTLYRLKIAAESIWDCV